MRIVSIIRKSSARVKKRPLVKYNDASASRLQSSPAPTPSITRAALGAYVAGINLTGFAAFWYDKHQALNRGWRIPEKSLQLTGLAGGWIGGMTAMNMFRHKTKKEPFKTQYFGCVALNVAVSGLIFWRHRRSILH